MYHYIYYIKNIETEKLYIGLTSNYKRRVIRHFSDLRNGRHDNVKLQRSFEKYGENSFEHGILFEGECSRDRINDLEIHYIKEYNSFRNGFNLNEGGSQNNGFESRFKKKDVFFILSAYEFSNRCGGQLSRIYNTSLTTIYRINNAESHKEFYNEYKQLSYDEKKKLFDELCNETNFLIDRNKSVKVDKLRKFDKKEVFMILSMYEFGKRKQKYMSDFLKCSKNTLAGIKDKKHYKDYSDEYEMLEYNKRNEIYNQALDYFNLNVSSYGNIC